MLDFANKLLEATEKSIAVSKALDSYLRADSGLHRKEDPEHDIWSDQVSSQKSNLERKDKNE